MADKNYLSYFIQFLDSRKALPLIKFWLDAESFRIAAEVCNEPDASIRAELCQTDDELNGQVKTILNKSVSLDTFNMNRRAYDQQSFDCTSLSSNVSMISDRIYNTESISNAPDVKSVSSDNDKSDFNSMTDIRDLSCDMDKPLTDDQKSQLFEQNSKLRKESQPVHIDDTGNDHNDDGDNVAITSGGQGRPAKTKKCFQSSLASDAIRIFKKYLASSKSINHIDVPATILSAISLALCAKESEDIDDRANSVAQIFTDAQTYMLERLESVYLNAFIESSFYCKYCVDILTGDNLKICDILHCEALLFYFMEFLEQENDRIYLDFWVAATHFKRQFDDNNAATTESYNIKQAQSDALILYEKYFSLQATHSLRMSDMVRYRIEERICAEHGPITDCFDLATVIIERFLNGKYLKSFLTSNLFYKYLSELLYRINGKLDETTTTRNGTTTNLPKNRHRKTFSDCTNDKVPTYRSVISSQNSLLAMESSPRIKVRPSSASDMHIESKQMYNPDVLWHRRNSALGLQFGRVDSLGRYERDFDMVTAHTSDKSFRTAESKIKQAVRKLVNLPEDKVQEEIAWQVAEMIVKDITNVTLNTPAGNELSLS